MSGCPSDNYRNRGPTQDPTAPRITNNVRQNIEETQEAAPTLCQAIVMVVVHPDAPVLSPSVLMIGDEWPALPARADTAHTEPALTETATPNPATPAAVWSGKRSSNCARPTDSQTASSSPPANPDSDVTSVETIRGSDGDSNYVGLAEKSPTSPANMPDLAGHIIKLEAMHKVLEVDINAITRPTVLFSYTGELKIMELANAENEPPENHQDNGVTPPVNTQPYPPQSPPEDTSVASAKPPPRPCIKAGDVALQAREGDLPDVCLLGTDYIFYGVYQDWVHQNPGDHLNGVIAEDSKWQARWEKLVCMPTQCYDAPSGKVGKIFVVILSVELDGVCARKWNAERVIVFQSVILQRA